MAVDCARLVVARDRQAPGEAFLLRGRLEEIRAAVALRHPGEAVGRDDAGARSRVVESHARRRASPRSGITGTPSDHTCRDERVRYRSELLTGVASWPARQTNSAQCSHRPLHGDGGVSAEPGLKHAHDGLTDVSEWCLWPRGCANPIHHVEAQRIDKHLEQLLAAFRMVGQRPVPERESRLVATVLDVDHPGAIQGPEPEMTNQDRYYRPGLDASVLRERVDPSDIELFPRQ